MAFTVSIDPNPTDTYIFSKCMNTYNRIEQENSEETTRRIQDIINKSISCLVIQDDFYKFEYANIFLPNCIMQRTIEVTLLQERKIVIPQSKFLGLVKFGLIKAGRYEQIIIRVPRVGYDLVDSFKIFYFLGLTLHCTRPEIYAFIQLPQPMDQVYLHARCEKFRSVACVQHIYLYDSYEVDLAKYLKMKRLAIEAAAGDNQSRLLPVIAEVNRLEAINYKKGLALLAAHVEFDGSICSKDEVDQYASLNFCEMRYSRSLRLINNYSAHGIVIVTDNLDVVEELRKDSGRTNIYHVLDCCTRSTVVIVWTHAEEVYALKQCHKIFMFYEGPDMKSMLKFESIRAFDYSEQQVSPVSALISHLNIDEDFYIVPGTNAGFTLRTSINFLMLVLNCIRSLLADHFVFFKNVIVEYDFQETNSECICVLRVPHFADHCLFIAEYKGKPGKTRQLARLQAYFSLVIELHTEGFLDDNLLPKEYAFIEGNQLYYEYVRRYYKIEKSKDTLQSLKSAFARFTKEMADLGVDDEKIVLAKYKGMHYVNAKAADTPSVVSRTEIKEVVDSEFTRSFFGEYPDTYSLYVFYESGEDDSNVGIICANFSMDTVADLDVQVQCVDTFPLSKEELVKIINYNILFFHLFFKNKGKGKNSECYFFVPVKSRGIDFEAIAGLDDNFMIGNVYGADASSDVLRENLLFNPTTKHFYVFDQFSETKTLEDVFITRDGACGFKSINYLDYYKSKYSYEFVNREGPNLLFHGFPFEKCPGKNSIVLCSEVCQITRIKISDKKMLEKLVRCMPLMKKRVIAVSLQTRYKLDLELSDLCAALTPQCLSENANYERLEFLGDNVLKYLASIKIFATYQSTKDAIYAKNTIVSNKRLSEIANGLGLAEYVYATKNISFHPPAVAKFLDDNSMSDGFQPVADYLSFFNCEGVFNASYVPHMPVPEDAKLYADVLEAIIGAVFIKTGLDGTIELMKQLNILPDLSITAAMSMATPFYTYHGIIPKLHISAIEGIIGYRFNNIGLVEKALLHPSSQAEHADSIIFNLLELIGDCTLDLFITKHVYSDPANKTPGQLHSSRKSYVNNFTLARMLFGTGLVEYIKTCFDAEYYDKCREILAFDGMSINKMFGDVLEAIIGAMHIDNMMDYSRTAEVLEASFLKHLVENFDTTR